MFLKDLIGKKVLSHEGKFLGYTRCAFFSSDFKRITALLCSDEEEEDFILPLSRKQIIDDVLVMPRRVSAKVTGKPYSPVLKHAYSLQGKFLGCISDAIVYDLTVISIVVEKTEYPVSRIKAFGDCVLINTAQTVSRPRGGKKSTAAKARPVILLGKILKHNIADKEGNVLFTKGTLITPTVLRNAFIQKKLLELTAKTLAD